jgi:drug/metabolite transporter (DMT)-like permease
MNQHNTTNQRSSKRKHADPPKSDGGAFFVKGDVHETALPRVSSYGNNIASAHLTRPNDDNAHYNNNLSARRTRRRPHPSYASSQRNNMNNENATGEYSPITKGKNTSSFSDRIPTAILVISWYSFGVVSIATSKILLSTYNLPPLLLTLQQLVIGVLLLRTILYLQTRGIRDEEYNTSSAGLQPVPLQIKQEEDGSNNNTHHFCENGTYKRKSSNETDSRTGRSTAQQQRKCGILSALFALSNPSAANHRIHNQLLLSAIYFTIGFYLTNCGFNSGSAAFVETIKAAEPITSAATAVLWGIEKLVPEEVASLGGIIVGVVLSTLGHRASGASPSNGELELTTASHSLLTSSCVVLLANLCFSFRGVHQKLFRSTPQGKATVVDDLNLQYRMQQIGCLLMSIPAVLENLSMPSTAQQYLHLPIRLLLRYFMLCLVNGIAFASYNLSSTTILTRISVVHHASLNCIRRVFAIVVTSVVFGLRISLLQICGITTSVGAFFSYIHFKSKKNIQQSRRREMQKKWGSLILDGVKWTGKTSSSLPMGNVED